MSIIRMITEKIFHNHLMSLTEASTNYQAIPDDELVLLVKKKDQQAYNELHRRYHKLAYAIIQKGGLFAPGMGKEDLAQEAHIGLVSAIRDYRPGSNKDFKQFAILTMRRNILDAIRSANTGKHSPVNKSNDIDDFSGIFHSKVGNPYTTLRDKEDRDRLIKYMKSKLTPWELVVMNYFLQGFSEEEIAEKTKKDKKAINNAKLKARGKLKGYLDIYRESKIYTRIMEALSVKTPDKRELKKIYEMLYY